MKVYKQGNKLLQSHELMQWAYCSLFWSQAWNKLYKSCTKERKEEKQEKMSKGQVCTKKCTGIVQ